MNSFPPVLTVAEYDILKKESADFCPAHGILMRPNELTIVPHTLFPTPFPAEWFKEALRIQPIFNSLVEYVSQDSKFIMESLVATCDQDHFTRNLMELLQGRENKQPIRLAIHRSDYMIDSKEGQETGLKQIEFNTISSGFSSLSSSVSELHRYMAFKTCYFADVKLDQLPANDSKNAPVLGISKAWELYGVKSAIVLFIVQNGEGNIFDQRHIEYLLYKRYHF